MARERSNGGLIGGAFLMGLGALALLAQFAGSNFWTDFWPMLVLGTGILFFAGMVIGGRGAGGLAIPGTIITTVGTILLLQMRFGYWHAWSYAWTLIIMSVGAGIFIKGLWDGDENSRRAGAIVGGIGFILFLVFGSFFTLGFGVLGFPLAARLVWPVVMMAVGLFLVLRWSARLGQRTYGVSHLPDEPGSDSSSQMAAR